MVNTEIQTEPEITTSIPEPTSMVPHRASAVARSTLKKTPTSRDSSTTVATPTKSGIFSSPPPLPRRKNR
ncbi:hypothetical protein BGX38DRAFT_1226573 [Terfezia claveryi]|nr:hypothetical protein BGX38DRAFT_1226573 [Terfezia claveryi]